MVCSIHIYVHHQCGDHNLFGVNKCYECLAFNTNDLVLSLHFNNDIMKAKNNAKSTVVVVPGLYNTKIICIF